ncbi:MAG: ATP-dependent RNA helicase DbpA [Cocleimonas sp.]|nr:ATP-dependent RNA helicase DbpA [Cocleimonas sp.]
MNPTSFSSLTLQQRLIHNLDTLNYHTMTAIQAQSLPAILSGKDMIGQAKTGSGKTAAFALGLLQQLDVKRFRIQSLVLCPTRELADQVAQDIRKLGRAIHNIKVLTLCGGMPFGPQRGSLEHGAHIIVGTPGRVEDHLNRRTLRLDDVSMLVLDEADRMLEMGFQEQLDAITKRIPDPYQTLLFSATFPPQIQKISQKIMNQPVMIKVNETHDNKTIQQHFYKITSNQERLLALRLLLHHFNPQSAVVFCNTKVATKEVAKLLIDNGFNALALNGDLEQRDREKTLAQFANRSITVLAATDVAARGLDIDAIEVVINFDIAHDPEIHLHRIGRTGRAGNTGIACSLYSDAEAHKLVLLEGDIDPIVDTESLPPESVLDSSPAQATMVTLLIDGGKKQKLRPGDILGALTSQKGLTGQQVGKIQIFDYWAYVAVHRNIVKTALDKLNQGKLKGRSFRVRQVQNTAHKRQRDSGAHLYGQY